MKPARSLVLAFLMSLVAGCADQAEPEIFLIEREYRGKVNIIFNQPKGQPPKYESGRRIYEIPSNGILITQFKDNDGRIDQQYFYVDSSGNREVLKELDVRDFNEAWRMTKNPNEPSRDELGVFFAAQVGVYGNSDDPKSLKFQEFYISTYRELKKFQDNRYEREFLEKIVALTGVRF